MSIEITFKKLGNSLVEGRISGKEFGMILRLSPEDGCYLASGYVYHLSKTRYYCPRDIELADVKLIASKVLGCDVMADHMFSRHGKPWPTELNHFSVVPYWWLAYRFPSEMERQDVQG